MRRPVSPMLLAVLFLASCGCVGPTDPPEGGNAISLELAPAAVLLVGAGEQQQLKAWAVDADGRRTEVAATFTEGNVIANAAPMSSIVGSSTVT